MLILLPPSEGKSIPTSGPRLDLGSLSFLGLTRTRSVVLDSLARLCRVDPEGAAEALGLRVRQGHEVGRNAAIKKAPCAPALSVYSGVLFEALEYSSLPAVARRRADRDIAVASALWGLVRPRDLIPHYRLSGSTSLPGLGTMSRVWHVPVSAAIEEEPGLIIDLRSGTYQALGPVPASCADRAVTVRVLQERDGTRSVVSHHNKSAKGRIARAVLISTARPATPAQFADTLTGCGFTVEAGAPPRPGAATRFDVIVAAD